MTEIVNKMMEGRKTLKGVSDSIYELIRDYKPRNYYQQRQIEKLNTERNRLEKSLMSLVNIQRRVIKIGNEIQRS